MSALATTLGDDVLTHLDAQIASARRLLSCILRQGAAIRERDVERVLAALSDVQAEMAGRGRLEEERALLLHRAGAALGLSAAGVTLEALTALMPQDAAVQARTLSAELRGLLAEIAREHGLNRALMRQELAFLDHLTRLVGREPEGGYRPPAGNQSQPNQAAPAIHRAVNLQA